MTISVRTLLALADPACPPEFRKLLEKRIRTREEQEEVERFVHRVQKICGLPLRVPELVDGCEELDPNCVAEYLDHQLTAEAENRIESLFLSSDVFLAELAGVSSVLNHSLGQAVEIPDEFRARLYEIGQETSPPIPTMMSPVKTTQPIKTNEALLQYQASKKLKESLEEWQWKRLNHIKNFVVVLVFFSVGLIVWNNRDAINQFQFGQEKQDPAETTHLSASPQEATMTPPQSVLESVGWDGTQNDLPFYTELENPDSVMEKTNEIRPASL